MPKLTLCDLFAVVTIVALILGWLVRSHLTKENTALSDKLKMTELVNLIL